MENLNTLAKEYAMALAAYHFLKGCAHQPWEARTAYNNVCDAQNRLDDAAKAFAETTEYCVVAY